MDKREGFLLVATGIYQFKQFHFIKIFLRRISIRKPNLKSRINLKLYEKPKMDWNNKRINVV